MNSTIIVLGPLVHAKFDGLWTYAANVVRDGAPKTLETVNTSRATITYIPESRERDMPRGMHYPTELALVGGSRVYMLCGSRGCDNTALGFVRFAKYEGMCVPLVCGCAVRDSVRFERAHIPLVFVPDDLTVHRFEDGAYGKIELFKNDAVYGVIDVAQKELHGSVWWVTIIRPPPQ
jgi:hypothetical protein